MVSEILGGGGTTPQMLVHCQKEQMLLTVKFTYINWKRQCVFVGADGPPYTLMRRLQKLSPKEFDWLAIVSGKGHLNMNQLKTLFKILMKFSRDLHVPVTK